MTKKKNLSLLEDSLNEAINPKEKIDRRGSVQALLGNYRDEVKELPQIPFSDNPAGNVGSPLPAESNNLASKDNLTQLTETIISASNTTTPLQATKNEGANLLAPQIENKLEQLAGKSFETVPIASKLAAQTKSASRTEAQLMADIRQSKGPRVQFATRIRSEVKQRFDVFCAEEGITQQDFVELSGISYIENYKKQLADLAHKSASNLAHDDLRLNTLWKTRPSIINLYLRYNSIFNEKTKWSTRDDDAGLPFNEVDVRLVELGILQTQANKGFAGKINSFNYYVPEIKNFIELEMSVEVLETMLQINRQRWRQFTGRDLDLSFLEEK